MITIGEISKVAKKHKIGAAQIEKDYVITWVLYGISQSKFLKENLAFKGGTVLKKAYFEDYRFSEDLDFTLLNNDVSNEDILHAFDEALVLAQDETGMTLKVNQDKEKVHLATNSLKFFIDYVAPLQGAMGSRDLKVDVTRGEVLEFDLREYPMFNEYSDAEQDIKINCYSLSEVLIEKMAAIMGRTIPRDVYDLWYLFEYEGLDLADHHIEFESKARNKGQDPNEFRKKFDGSLEKYRSAWKKSLENQMPEVPAFDDVIRELNKHFRKHY